MWMVCSHTDTGKQVEHMGPCQPSALEYSHSLDLLGLVDLILHAFFRPSIPAVLLAQFSYLFKNMKLNCIVWPFFIAIFHSLIYFFFFIKVFYSFPTSL